MIFGCELKRVVDDSYDIEIGRQLSDKLVADLKAGLCGKASRFAVVTDSNVEGLYALPIMEKLASAGLRADL